MQRHIATKLLGTNLKGTTGIITEDISCGKITGLNVKMCDIVYAGSLSLLRVTEATEQ